MEWTEPKDLLLCKEIVIEEPFRFKKGSIERGKSWTKVAETLNGNQEYKFSVDQRGVRERMETLKKNYRDKMKEEESASGIDVDDPSEIDSIVNEIIDIEKEYDEARESSKVNENAEADKEKAQEMRKVAMESFGETSKRSEGENDSERKTKKRRSGNDAIEFLKEKAQLEKELSMEEIALKKEAQEQEAARQQQLFKQQQGMVDTMQAMMQQQQQQSPQ